MSSTDGSIPPSRFRSKLKIRILWLLLAASIWLLKEVISDSEIRIRLVHQEGEPQRAHPENSSK